MCCELNTSPLMTKDYYVNKIFEKHKQKCNPKGKSA